MRAPAQQVLLARAWGCYLHAQTLLGPCGPEYARVRGLVAVERLRESLECLVAFEGKALKDA